jgi:hypothetical protein
MLLQKNIFRNKIHYTGFLQPEKVSNAINSCTIGLTPVPRHVLGKSGAVAAFLSHGKPVAAPNVHQGFGTEETGFFCKDLFLPIIKEPALAKVIDAKNAVAKVKNIISVSTVAKQFINDLKDV